METGVDTAHLDGISNVINSLIGVHEIIWNSADNQLETNLCYLVLLRVSQINQCGFCVAMHAKEARECGETNERLDQLPAYKHSSLFSSKEKIALEWAERLTTVDPDTDYVGLRERLKVEFSNKNIGLLTSIVGLINLWNRLRISTH